MSLQTGRISAVASSFRSYSANPEHELGVRVESTDGRAYRYVKAGDAALVVGNLLQSPAEVTNHQNLAPTANVAVGASSFTVTLGATLATANQYANGFAVITVTPGLGYAYEIESHPAAAQSATLLLTLKDKISVALTTAASKVDLVANPYNGVIQNPTTASGTVVGVAVSAIPASYYGWIQTAGVAAILNDGGSTVGTNVSASNGTAGAVEAAVTAQAAVGRAVTGIATTEVGAVMLNIE